MSRASLCAGLLLVAVACSKPKPTPDAGPTCGARVCGSYMGLNCGTCTDNGVCADDQLSCRAALAIGSPCQTDLDCGTSPYLCLNADAGIQAPNGYCSEPCGDGGVTCPSGSSCQQDVHGDSVCLAACASDNQCRSSDGYTCGDAGICQACVGSCTGKACGDDGCGGSCGITTPMVPVCNTASQVCSSGECVTYFNRLGSLPGADYPHGLWDATAVDLSGQIAGGGVAVVGGRETLAYNNDGGTAYWPSAVPTVDIYNPSGAGSFSNITSLPNGLARPNAAAWNGSIYVAGGTDVPDVGVSGGDSADSAFYREKTDSSGGTPVVSWQQLADVPDPSVGGGAVVMGHILYLVAGQTVSGPSSTLDTYDLTQSAPGTWNTVQFAARPTARSFPAVVTDGNRLFVIGGSDGAHALATVEAFDPVHGWSTWPSLAIPVVDPRAAIASGRIFVIGGHQGLNEACCQVPYVQTIDLRTGNVQLIGSTYQKLTNQAVVSLPSGNFLLFGAESLTGPGGTYAINSDVVQLTIPSP